ARAWPSARLPSRPSLRSSCARSGTSYECPSRFTRGPAVGARVAARDADREPFEVERPTMAVVVDRVVGQARVHETHAGLVAFGMQADLDGGRSGRDRMAVFFPAEGEHHLLHGNDLDVFPRRLELTGDQHPVDAA